MQRIVREQSTKDVSVPQRIVTLGADVVDEPAPVSVVKSPEPIKQIPPKQILGSSLSGLNGYDNLRKQIKAELKIKEFVQETQQILKMFDIEEKKYDYKIVKYVCELAEHWFISEKKSGAVKEMAVVSAVQMFYNNDEQLVKSIIQLVLPNIKKSNVLRRCQSKIKKAFFLFAKIIFGVSLI